MIVISRRHEPANPFVLRQRQHYQPQFQYQKAFDSFDHPFYLSHQPLPSFYHHMPVVDPLEAAIMSHYHQPVHHHLHRIHHHHQPRRINTPMMMLSHFVMKEEKKSTDQRSADGPNQTDDKVTVKADRKENGTMELSEPEKFKPSKLEEKKDEKDKACEGEEKCDTDDENEVDPREALLQLFQQLSQSVPPVNHGKSEHHKESVNNQETNAKEQSLTITINVSGYNAADLTVAYESGILTVSGKHSNDAGIYESFTRKIPLDEHRFDVDNVSARLIDGKLSVCVPRRAPSMPRTIAITSEDMQRKHEPSDHTIFPSGLQSKEEDSNVQARTSKKAMTNDGQEENDKNSRDTADDKTDHDRISNTNQDEVVSIGDSSSQKDSNVSVRTVSSDDEDEEGEETYEVA